MTVGQKPQVDPARLTMSGSLFMFGGKKTRLPGFQWERRSKDTEDR